jgi:hypothetical protein
MKTFGAIHLKKFGAIGTMAAFFLLGGTVVTFAQEEHHEEAAKPAEHEEAAKPPRQEEAKPPRQEEAKRPEEGKPVDRQQEAKPPVRQEQKTQEKTVERKETTTRTQETNSRWARSGTKDHAGHVYDESRFGPSHSTHFVVNSGRVYNGRREYSYGGYWFYAASYPPWFYQQEVYFVLGAGGIWYAVAVNDPSLTFAVEIG